MNTDTGEHLLRVKDLGQMDYAQAFAVQQQVHADVLAGHWPGTVLLVEHEPVITVSKRKTASGHVLVDKTKREQLGIDLQITNRGGDVTYHGPGQLVAYPIMALSPLHLNVGRYMRLLEQVVIETAKHFAVDAGRQAGMTGVWVTDPIIAKLAALGVRVKRNVTLHGLALNVSTQLDHFQTIVPCGLDNRNVTSLKQLLGDRCPTIQAVKNELVKQLCRQLGCVLEDG